MHIITRKIHAYLDYPVAVSLMALPFVLGLGTGNPVAKWLAVATGVAAFILTMFTDHELGAFKLVPYRAHVAVDRLVGVIFVAAPFVFGFTGLDAVYYSANGATVLLVTTLLDAPAPRLATASA
jgi:hypothetical protein